MGNWRDFHISALSLIDEGGPCWYREVVCKSELLLALALAYGSINYICFHYTKARGLEMEDREDMGQDAQATILR